jgi:hypothetical protein
MIGKEKRRKKAIKFKLNQRMGQGQETGRVVFFLTRTLKLKNISTKTFEKYSILLNLFQMELL